MDLANEKAPGAINTEGTASHTIDSHSSCRSIEINAESRDRSASWIWCQRCKCLSNSAIFTQCSKCGQIADQLEVVDEVAARQCLQVAS